MKLAWLASARIGRAEAISYIAQRNPRAALAQLDEVQRQLRLLQSHPEMGRPGRMPGSRELVIGRTPFIVVYRVMPGRVEILNFLHGAQKWPPDGD